MGAATREAEEMEEEGRQGGPERERRVREP